VAIPLSGRVPGRAFGPSQSQVDDSGGSRYVSGKVIGSLGFSRRGVFIGEGATSKVISRFYQILGDFFFAFILYALIENSQGFKTF
jgi:hypothetical protein